MKLNLKNVLIFTLILLFSQTVYTTEEAETTDQPSTEEQTEPPAETTGDVEAGGGEKAGGASLDDSMINGNEIHQLHLQKCNKKIMNAFGFLSEDRGLEMELGMCPSVKHSCCKLEDQVTMYEMWIAAKGKDHLENKFKIQTGVI